MLKNRIALLALVSVCSSFGVVGCSGEGASMSTDGEQSADLHTMEFNLSVDGATLATVAYEVKSSAGATIKSGNFEVPLNDPSFSAQLLLPVGSDYTLSISGTGSKDGRSVPCLGSAEFDVVAGSNPPVNMTVTCTDTITGDDTAPQTGDVRANVTFVLDTVIQPGEECGFTHGVVGPLAQLVGNRIDLKSSYVPASASTSWSSSNPIGTFADAAADETTFTCNSAGTTVLSTALTTAGGCADTFSVEVECVLVSCGNGTVDAGEQCDDGNTINTDACSNACTTNPICGNNIVEAGETCATCQADVIAEGGADACAACGDGVVNSGENCTTCPADVIAVDGPAACNVCGDGTTAGAEECDDSNTVSGDGCSATCVVEFCGDGTVNGTNEQCDDGGNANGDGCSATCQNEDLCGNGVVNGGEDCTTCPEDQPAGTCGATVNACTTCLETDPAMVANGIAQYQISLCSNDPLCVAVQECLGRTDCFSREPNSLYFSDCFCGVGADQAACVSPSFVPTGACIPEITAAAGRTLTNEEGATSLTDVNNFPSLGYGFLWVDYARQFGVCTTECGLDGTTNGVE